jgi:ribosomal-protein-alanine N-acetyltransferase
MLPVQGWRLYPSRLIIQQEVRKMNIPTLTTARLILRPLAKEDVAPLHRLWAEEGVMRYFPNPAPPSRERVERMVSASLEHWAAHGFGWWAVVLGETGELMGRSGLWYLPETEEVEIDFLLGKPFWGQGYATEAGQADLYYGFERLGLERIIGLVHPENLASQRVLEKLGLTFVEQRHYFGIECYRYLIERSRYEPGAGL